MMEKKREIQKALPWIVLAAVLCFATIGLDDTFAAVSTDGSVSANNGILANASVLADGGIPADGSTPVDGEGEEIPAIPEPTEKGTLSCTTDGTNIKITGSVTGEQSDPAYYDGYIYLFELKAYEREIGSRTDYAGWQNRTDPVSFTLPLGFGTEDDKLYSSFVLAVYDGTAYHAISEPAFVNNPEVLARNKNAYKEPLSKKGLLLDGDMIADAMYLGVKNTSVTIAFQQILGQGIDYTYDGKTYHFNKEMVEYYDNIIMRFSMKDISVTAILVNGWNDNTPELIPPGVEKKPKIYYYMFNTATKEGVETLKAVASFLAERYSGLSGSKGKVSNWIIGNEINNQEWNYIGPMEQDAYVAEYLRAFRLFYTAIRSVSANDRLFFSTDFFWNDPEASDLKYSAREVIRSFARMAREGGDMDWGLAYHPYADPLTEPEFWDDGANGRVTDSMDSLIVNFANLHILTDFMRQSQLLDQNGEVRHIILSEQGFTSKSATRGDVEYIQAAALAYAYYIADSNPYIDAVLMHRQVDNVSEASTYVAVGLWECDMNSPNTVKATMRKKAWEVFKNMDTKRSLATNEFAKEIIGIEKWSDVIPNFKWKNFE